jgi:hypothetical protein
VCPHVPSLGRAARGASVARGAAVALFFLVHRAAAQAVTPIAEPELRTDVIAAHSTAFEAAGGVAFVTGDYLRLGGDLGLGVVTGGGQRVRLGSRIDATGRFHLDSAATHWGPYLVAGVSYRADARERGALYLLAALGVHAPATAGIVPAMEVGLGGGVRVGLVLAHQ